MTNNNNVADDNQVKGTQKSRLAVNYIKSKKITIYISVY